MSDQQTPEPQALSDEQIEMLVHWAEVDAEGSGYPLLAQALRELQQRRAAQGEPETQRAWDEGRTIVCASCGTVNEASVQNREEVIEHLYKGPIPCVVPVWTCHVCKESWTDYMAERIRDAAVKAAPDKVTR